MRLEVAIKTLFRRIFVCGENMLKIKNLCKKYGKREVLKQLSMNIEKGEIVALIGVNGSGKSTLIELICGVKKFDSGEIFINGTSLEDKKGLNKIRFEFGYMPQHFSLFNDLTVRENLEYMQSVYLVANNSRIDDILKLCFLEDKQTMLAKNLSGGYKQLLSLASSLLHQPKLLILDEPTSAMDPLFRKQFWSVIHKLNKEGTTIFVTTHHMEEIFECQRLDCLANGKIVFSEKVEELFGQGKSTTIEEILKKYILKDKYEQG